MQCCKNCSGPWGFTLHFASVLAGILLTTVIYILLLKQGLFAAEISYFVLVVGKFLENIIEQNNILLWDVPGSILGEL